MPATSSPTTRAASSAISTLSGCASRVRSIEMPPVDMLPVRVSLTIVPSGGTSSMREALLADQLHRGVVDLDAGEHLLVADAAARVGVGLVDQLADGADAVADDVRGHPLGERDHPAADDEHAVVLAGDERLDDDPAAPGLLLARSGTPRVTLVGVLEVEHHAAAVVAVQRLARRRGSRSGCATRTACSAVRTDSDRGTGRPADREQPGGQLLVAGDVDGERRGLRRHGRADALLVDALAELHQRVLVEPQPRDVAGHGLVEDRLRRRPERGALRPAAGSAPARRRSRTPGRPGRGG